MENCPCYHTANGNLLQIASRLAEVTGDQGQWDGIWVKLFPSTTSPQSSAIVNYPMSSEIPRSQAN